jgi:hypothetical protein
MRYRPERERSTARLRRLTIAACLAIASVSLPHSFAEEPWRASEAERRQRLLTMDAAEKERLERQVERFESLSSSEKQQLRTIHEELSKADDGDHLYAVLQRYCEWLKTLNAAERAELVTLPAEGRVARIRQLMKQQEEQRFRRLADLSPEDTRAVLDWLDELVEPHEETLTAMLSDDSRKFVRRLDDPRTRRKMTLWNLLRERKMVEMHATIEPSSEELARLLEQLSPHTQEEFRKIGDLKKQQELVRNWIGWAVSRPSYRPVSDAELHAFFTTLPTEKQAELERLSREEMHNELRKLYFASRFRFPDFGRPGDGGGRPPFRGQFNREGGGRFERPRSDENQPFAKPPGN